MRKFAAALLLALSAYGADWLMSRADPQGTGWQQHGRSISVNNAHELKLLWKKTLDNESRGLNSLTAPTILGPIITHRGIKELVFVGGSSNNIYAVDADLGRVFWKRHIETEPVKGGCDEGLTAAPAFAPPPPGTRIREESDEGASPMRPFYFVAGDGVLHTIRPSDGLDIAPTRKFVAPGANLGPLRTSHGQVYTTSSGGCGGIPDGVWALDTANPGAEATFTAATNGLASIGQDGTVYAASGSPVAPAAPIPITWKGKTLLLTSGEGQLLQVKDLRGLATWVDASGVRWVYATTANNVQGLRMVEQAEKPTLNLVWNAPNILSPLDPVIMNGVVFVLAGGNSSTHAILYAFDAHTGERIYSSGDAVTSFVHSSGLAVANGHVFFGTQDNTLYCFGFPIEIE